jgi:ABC-2 type transport system permease protein
MMLAGLTTRRSATSQALGGLGAGLVALFGVTAAVTLAVGREHKVGIGVAPSLYFSLSLVCGAAIFMAAGALASQLAASRRQAAGYAGAALGLFYALRMIADSSHGFSWMSWLTPLGWIERLQPLTGPHPVVLLPIGVLTVVMGVGAVSLAGRRDLGAGVIPSGGHARSHTTLLGSTLGLAVRLSRATVLAWYAAICAFALLYGGVAKQAVKSLASSPSSRQIVERLGGRSAEMKSYLGIVFLLMTLLVAFVAANQVTAARREEASGRLEHLLVRPVSRIRWLGERSGLASVIVIVASLLAGTFVWIGTLSQETGVGLHAMLGAALNGVPPVLLLLGIGVLALGVVPRLASGAVYAVLSWSFLVTLLGGAVRSNHWFLDTSLFHQMQPAPAVAPDWHSGFVMIALGATAAAVGAWWLRRRDLAGE